VKVDFKKELKELYNPKAGVFSLVKVPKLQYRMVDEPSLGKLHIPLKNRTSSFPLGGQH
jgi:hypothetical protein